jgi:hypothetical protein
MIVRVPGRKKIPPKEELMAFRPVDFVPAYYLKMNLDVAKAYGAQNNQGALSHYQKYGMGEGRSPNPFFDPKYYLNTNPDIAKAYGATNYTGAMHHWTQWWSIEGRRGSPIFAVQFYLQTYPDLVAAFGRNGYTAAYNHYQTNGIHELRRGVPESTQPIFNAQGMLDPAASAAFARVIGDLAAVLFYAVETVLAVESLVGDLFQLILPDPLAQPPSGDDNDDDDNDDDDHDDDDHDDDDHGDPDHGE